MSATPTEVATRWFKEVWNERKPATIALLQELMGEQPSAANRN